MAFYEIQHHILLTSSQQDELAEAITKIHADQFGAVKQFVRVTFTDTSNTRSYIGGEQQGENRIVARVRHGQASAGQDWDQVCAQISAAWQSVVGVGLPKVRRSEPDQDTSLGSVIVEDSVMGGREIGIPVHRNQCDAEWMNENWEKLEARANDGDEKCQKVVADARQRQLLEGKFGWESKEAQRRLEEYLGWGDAA
ncbi:hypothetical protein K470DRAFT_256654 [Piedraia hortae CBS 480.64]|uniref:Tautomerase cis-CaaD-like domain-containing protein n=1 Tax=Piedraia hortae CBS 480.64 TaxID=1314780 RepID=A0A6A7C3I5_9PEZI|nr:hypothetical protein K470DRAFT_256654 [Piedraia hortae CBS 480.64]